MVSKAYQCVGKSTLYVPLKHFYSRVFFFLLTCGRGEQVGRQSQRVRERRDKYRSRQSQRVRERRDKYRQTDRQTKKVAK